MNDAQEYSNLQPNQPSSTEKAEVRSMSTTMVAIIFSSIFLIVVLTIGTLFYFFTGKIFENIKQRISLENQKTTSNNQISQPLNQDTEKRNQYYLDINEAKNLWSAGSYQESLDKANKALPNAETNEDKAVAHYWIGLNNYKLQNSSVAESELKQALELYSNYAAPYVTLSVIEMDRSNFQKAFEYAQKCVSLDSKYAWCHNSLGLSLLYLGEKDQGIKELEQAVSLAPDSYVFRDNLTRARQMK